MVTDDGDPVMDVSGRAYCKDALEPSADVNFRETEGRPPPCFLLLNKKDIVCKQG